MNDLRDTRPHVGRTVTDARGIKASYALAASEAVFELLSGNPNIELATIRLHPENEYPPRVTATGRVGSLVGPAGDPGELTYVALPGTESAIYEEPSHVGVLSVMACCGQLEGRPHTDYCQGLPRCSAPRDALPGGRGCSDDNCPVHAEDEPDHATHDIACACHACTRRPYADPAGPQPCPCTYTAGPMEPDQHRATCPDRSL